MIEREPGSADRRRRVRDRMQAYELIRLHIRLGHLRGPKVSHRLTGDIKRETVSLAVSLRVRRTHDP